MSHRYPGDFGPGSRARLYHSVAPLADSLESVAIDIQTPGDAGDQWELILTMTTGRYVVQEGDTASDVAEGLRLSQEDNPDITIVRLGTVLTVTRIAALQAGTAYPGGANQAELFVRISTPGHGEAGVTKLDQEPLTGRGELRILQSSDDPTPLDAPESPDLVDLGTSEAFAILTKTGITSAGTEVVTGDMGVSPAAAASITGFALVLDGSGEFSTSAEVTGQVYAADYAAPTPAMLTAAVSDMEAAYTDGMSRSPDSTELAAGLIGGLTLVPGVYKWTTGVTISSDLTLDGPADGVWIFQIDGALALAASTDILLTGGALPENVFWVVAGGATAGAAATLRGVVLSQTTVVLGVGTVLEGRALAQTATTLNGSTVTQP